MNVTFPRRTRTRTEPWYS